MATVASPFNAFLEGRQARQQQDQAQQKNALLQMQVQNAPYEQQRQNRLLDLQTQGAEQDIQYKNAQMSGLADQKRLGAIKQLGSLAQQAIASPNPRGFVQQAVSNPAYAQLFKEAGMDTSKLDLNSPSFDQDVQTWASFGEQPTANDRFNAGEKAKERTFTGQQNDLTRQNALNIATTKEGQQEGNASKIASAKLRKEFRGLQSVKDYETTLPLIESAKRAPDTRAGDLQLIYTVGKVLDPGSVVREGELKLTQGAAPFVQQLAGKIRGEFGKGRLTPQTRAEMVATLEQRQSGYKDAYTRDYDTYSQYATDSGTDAFGIVGKRPETAYAPSAQTQAGQPKRVRVDASGNVVK